MRIIKSTMLAMLAASLSIASFTASANEDDWRALQRAKINAAQAVVIATDRIGGYAVELDFDEDDGRGYYEVEVHNGNQKHEVKINAYTCKIIKTESDGERLSGGRPEVSLQQAIITAERETQGKAIKADLENRGDRDSYYEVDTIRRNIDYEVKIDARSGKVLHIDRDD